MSKSDSLDKNNRPSTESPFTTFVRLDGKSSVPSEFRTPNTFIITRLRSPIGLPDRITKLSAAPPCWFPFPLRLCRGQAISCGQKIS